VSHIWVGSMPDAYERLLVPAVFRPFAADLAARVARRSPARVLELAAGTGVLARELVARLPEAEVTATDLNGAMVALGRERAPGATWREADALALPFDDREFDAVACQFGAMFFPDKRAAFAECRRALAPAGALLLNTWGTLDTHDFQDAVVAGLRRVFPDDPPTFLEALPHGYADPDAVTADLVAAGLRPVAVEQVTLEGRTPSAAAITEGYCAGTPLRGEVEARGDLATVTAAVAREVERLLGPGPLTGRMQATVFEAVPV